ncbi:hypothetical protein L6452_24115 [Arctium lappa]|uniref:Uncharacterized protein n=1 Tax=Arctium lappa TaxID=4217 RepID=A0ACB9A8Y4_ARCLA|nr:hypothetical protein L6452_24115 [Arctium lappa]
MDFKVLKWQLLRGSLAWRLILRALFFVAAMVVLSFTRIANEIRTTDPISLSFDKCSLNIGSIVNTQHNTKTPRISQISLEKVSIPCVDGMNLTVGVIRELMNKEMLSLDARSLCVGQDSDSIALTMRELGFSNAFGVHSNPLLSLLRKQFHHKLDFDANSFDLVFSVTLEKASVPALLVLEIERVLRPGGVGAMLLGSSTFYTHSLVRSATPVALLLRSSEILHVCGIGSFTLIVFKKHLENVAFFDDYKLPNDCPSISKNKPFMKHIEPLGDQDSARSQELSYLPKFLNVSSRNRLIYINMGAGEFDRRYPIHPDAFNVYVVDHNVSALTSHVKKPGVTFVYHPGLVEDDKTAPSLMPVDYLEAPLHEEQFEFIDWFKETAKDGDFVVLMMNAGAMQLKVLFELFVSGAICHVDELFLRCSDGVDCRTSYCRDCTSLYNGLRNAGVFVHQWSGD